MNHLAHLPSLVMFLPAEALGQRGDHDGLATGQGERVALIERVSDSHLTKEIA